MSEGVYSVVGWVPVVVVVDIDESRVHRVVIIDEAFSGDARPGGYEVRDSSDNAGPDLNPLKPVLAQDPNVDRAIEIAEGDAGWPGWEFGW